MSGGGGIFISLTLLRFHDFVVAWMAWLGILASSGLSMDLLYVNGVSVAGALYRMVVLGLIVSSGVQRFLMFQVVV